LPAGYEDIRKAGAGRHTLERSDHLHPYPDAADHLKANEILIKLAAVTVAVMVAGWNTSEWK